MWHTTLHRPRPPTEYFFPLPYRDYAVLMPCNFPVRARQFVEQDAANRKRACSQDRLDQSPNRLRRCKFSYSGDAQQVTEPSLSATQVRFDGTQRLFTYAFRQME